MPIVEVAWKSRDPIPAWPLPLALFRAGPRGRGPPGEDAKVAERVLMPYHEEREAHEGPTREGSIFFVCFVPFVVRYPASGEPND